MTDSIDQPKSAGWRDHPRYPDPAIKTVDASFDALTIKLAAVERLYTGCRWSEGPVWFSDGRYLLWSDIPNNRILKWEEETGSVSVYRRPSNFANSHTRDRQGRLVGCEHGGRRVVRTEHDGHISVVADSYDDKPLNSPNDVIVKSDGSIWFTDPVFGILGYYEGYKHEPQLGQHVYRVDGETGAITVVADDILGPNGLCFSPDESTLYIVESRGVPSRKILAYDVTDGGKSISNRRIHIDAGAGTPDGMRCDMRVIFGAAGEWANPVWMASSFSMPTGSISAVSNYPNVAPMFALADFKETDYSWRRVSRCTPSTSTHRA